MIGYFFSMMVKNEIFLNCLLIFCFKTEVSKLKRKSKKMIIIKT